MVFYLHGAWFSWSSFGGISHLDLYSSHIRVSGFAFSHYSHIAFSCLSPMVLVRHICITRTISDVVVPMRGVHVDKDG